MCFPSSVNAKGGDRFDRLLPANRAWTVGPSFGQALVPQASAFDPSSQGCDPGLHEQARSSNWVDVRDLALARLEAACVQPETGNKRFTVCRSEKSSSQQEAEIAQEAFLEWAQELVLPLMVLLRPISLSMGIRSRGTWDKLYELEGVYDCSGEAASRSSRGGTSGFLTSPCDVHG